MRLPLEAVTVLTPDSSLARPREMLREMFRDLGRARELAWRLALRDIRAQYRQTAFGVLWAFLSPLVTALTWIFLRRSGVVAVGDTGLPYPLYVFSGSILWSILVESMMSPLNQTAAATNMLAKLRFPREAVVMSGVLQVLFNAGIKLILLVGALVLTGILPGWQGLLFPLSLLALVLVGTAIGLLLTPVGTLYTDIRRGLPLVMSLVMYLTPVVFPLPRSGWARALYELNPFSALIVTGRAWLTGSESGMLGYFCVVNAAAIVLLLLGWIAYRLAMPILIERMSA